MFVSSWSLRGGNAASQRRIFILLIYCHSSIETQRRNVASLWLLYNIIAAVVGFLAAVIGFLAAVIVFLAAVTGFLAAVIGFLAAVIGCGPWAQGPGPSWPFNSSRSLEGSII